MVYLVKAYVGNKQRNYLIEANSIKEIPELLYEKTGATRTTILNITPLTRYKTKAVTAKKGKIKKQDLELFCRQMQVLLNSGITVLESLEILADQTENKKLKTALKEIAENVKAGFSLSASMAGYPHLFNSMFVNSIKAAEESGTLPETLGYIADTLKKEAELSLKIIQAITYPAIVTLFAILVTLGLFLFVVPKFTKALTESGLKLPLITRIILAISQNFIFIIIGFLALIFILLTGLKIARRNEPLFAKIELFFIRIPVIGRISKYSTLSRFFWTFSILTKTGITVTESLDILAESTPFYSFRNEVYLARNQVEKGDTIASGFSGSAWINQMLAKLIAVGERSGRLDKMLEHCSLLMDKQLDAILAKLPSFLEVSTTIAVGVGVMIVLLSLFLPYASVFEMVK